MKKSLFFLTILLSAFAAQAQLKYQILATQELCVQRNVMKAPPTLETDSGLIGPSELYTTGFFSKSALKLKLANKLGQKGDYRLIGNIMGQQFVGLSEANQGHAIAEARVRYHFTKKVNASLTGGIGQIDRLGINVLADEEMLRFSYFTTYLKPELTIKFSNTNRTRLFAQMGLRKYDALPSGTDLSFRSREIGFVHTLKLTKQNALTLSATSARRNYHNRLSTTAIELDDEELAELNGNYFMGYNTLKLAYKHKADANNYYRFYAQLQQRKDRATEEWTYLDARVGANAEVKFNKLGLAGNGYIAIRNFPNRIAFMEDSNTDVDEEQTLQYKYLNVSITPKYYISDRFTLYTGVQLVNRFSNSTDQTKRARRSYHQTTAIAGLTWKFD